MNTSPPMADMPWAPKNRPLLPSMPSANTSSLGIVRKDVTFWSRNRTVSYLSLVITLREGFLKREQPLSLCLVPFILGQHATMRPP